MAKLQLVEDSRPSCSAQCEV